MRKMRFFFVSTVVLPLAACAADSNDFDEDESNERIGEAGDAFTGWAGISVVTESYPLFNEFAQTQLSVSSGTRTFLSAVYGNLYPLTPRIVWIDGRSRSSGTTIPSDRSARVG